MQFMECAQSMRSHTHIGLEFENLEERRLLSVTKLTEPISVEPVNATTVLMYVRQDDGNAWQNPNSSTGAQWSPYYPKDFDALPFIPLDDSIDPIVNCPLHDEFCLPADSEPDIFGRPGGLDFRAELPLLPPLLSPLEHF